jgi:hypothetical protein
MLRCHCAQHNPATRNAHRDGLQQLSWMSRQLLFLGLGEEQVQAVAGWGNFCCQKTAILLSRDELIMNMLYNQAYTVSEQYVLRRDLRHSATSLL